MFSFTKNSMVVNAWVALIKAGQRKFEEVPALWNLREVVEEVLKGGEE